MYKVGGDVDCRCTRCKMELAHTILALIEGESARVKCNTCHTDRKYRALKSATAPTPVVRKRPTATPSSSSSSSRPTASARSRPVTHTSAFESLEAWKAVMSKAEARGTEAKDYSMRETFASGDVVQHSKFGLGYVVKPEGTKKIVVCFREGEKLLIHGRP